jgi:hypothetical protein
MRDEVETGMPQRRNAGHVMQVLALRPAAQGRDLALALSATTHQHGQKK